MPSLKISSGGNLKPRTPECTRGDFMKLFNMMEIMPIQIFTNLELWSLHRNLIC